MTNRFTFGRAMTPLLRMTFARCVSALLILGLWLPSSGSAQAGDAALSELAVDAGPGVEPTAPSSALATDAEAAPSAPLAEPSPARALPAPSSPTPASDAVLADGMARSHAESRGAVRFVENEGRALRLYERKESEWLSVCTSPCKFAPAEGPRDYAVAASGGLASRSRLAGKGLWLVAGDGLQAELRDRRVVRKLGAAVVGAGLLVLAFLPLTPPGKSDGASIGLMVGAGGLVVSGTIMLLMRDRFQLQRCIGCYPRGRSTLDVAR
jgi:hypothetical protein